MVNWRALEAAVDGKIGAIFGEEVRLSFMKNAAVDPDRGMIDVRCMSFAVAGDVSTKPDSGYAMRLSAGQAELCLDRSIYTGPIPVQGDKVRATDRAGAPWFEVAHVSDRHSNIIVVRLNQA